MKKSTLEKGTQLVEQIEMLQRHIEGVTHFLTGIELNEQAGRDDRPLIEMYWEGCDDDGVFLQDAYFDIAMFLKRYLHDCNLKLERLGLEFEQL